MYMCANRFKFVSGSKLQTPAQKEGVVFVHPSVMQLCGFSFGGFCIGKYARYRIYPIYSDTSILELPYYFVC